MLESVSHANGFSESESDDELRFFKSLQELKDLRSQIHQAADYWEQTFLNAKEKADVLDNTREYLCRAIVTVVDHVGSVATNLNQRIEKSDRVSETELQINCLKQKVNACDQYNQNFTLTKTRRSSDLPRLHPRYISPPSHPGHIMSSLSLREHNQPTDAIIVHGQEFKTDEDMPLFMYTSSTKISLYKSPRSSPLVIEAKGTAVVPIRDGFSVAPKLIRNPSFHFQERYKRAGGLQRMLKQWKSMNDSEIISTLRKYRRQPSRLLLKLKS